MLVKPSMAWRRVRDRMPTSSIEASGSSAKGRPSPTALQASTRRFSRCVSDPDSCPVTRQASRLNARPMPKYRMLRSSSGRIHERLIEKAASCMSASGASRSVISCCIGKCFG